MIGEGPFRGLFSLLSLLGIVWLSRAYSHAEYIQLWGKLYAFRPYALVVMLLSFFFVVLAFTSPNPTAVGGEALLAEKEPAKGIQRITRHPFLWGVTLWSFTHLILNGDLASGIFSWQSSHRGNRRTFFNRSKAQESCRRGVGSIRRPDVKRAIYGNPSGPQLAKTSRDRVVAADFLALILYGLFLHFHQTLFGVSPLPM